METINYCGKEFPLKGDNNANIIFHVLDDDIMRLARFTDVTKNHWYYCHRLCDDITFNVRVSKTDPNDWSIDILDENFLQPYDYQAMIQREYEGEKFPGEYHRKIDELVSYEMEHLYRLGIIDGWTSGDYI